MKRICFITTIPTTIESFISGIASYIHKNTAWDISFICNDENDFSKNLPDYIHYFPVHMERGIHLSDFKAIGEMYRIFKREKFDLIQYSTPNASLFASIAGKLAGIPIRLYCQWGIAYVGFNGIKRWIFKQEEKFVCGLSTWIEPDSKSNLVFAHNEKLYPRSKGAVVWNGSACGVDLQKFNHLQRENYRQLIRTRYSLPEDVFVFGFAGRITRDKGINELLEACKRLIEQNDNIYLMLVGRPEINKSVNADLYSWAQCNEHIIFTGYSNVVEQYLSAMDCFLLPSYREGFGMGVIEAEAMGIPVIVTDIPGPTDAIISGTTGLVVPKQDADSLYKAMVTMVENVELRRQLGEAGHQFVVDNFEQEKLFAHILEDRKKLLGLH